MTKNIRLHLISAKFAQNFKKSAFSSRFFTPKVMTSLLKDILTFRNFDLSFWKNKNLFFLNKETNLKPENLLTIDFQVPKMKQMCV